MALKIRLRQQGRNNRPFYRVVVADARSPRDGKYVEALGWYNPFESDSEKGVFLNQARIQHWMDHGAEISENVESLLHRQLPALMKINTDKQVAKRAKALAKRKNRKVAKA
ncbi:30S ribosomal protein S16 [Chlamydiales bacterium STE3]|nr:30S ribosomal protein S16 [Chlamydiales bacterium STE3]